MIDFEAKR